MSKRNLCRLSFRERELARNHKIDPERMASQLNCGHAELRRRLVETGQPEPIEPKRCVNCRQHESPGCCDVFDVNRMLGLGLIDFGPPAETYACPDKPKRYYSIENIVITEGSHVIGVDFAKGDSITVADPLYLEPCHCGKAGKLGQDASGLWLVECESMATCPGIYGRRDPPQAAEAWNHARIRDREPLPSNTPASARELGYETSALGEWSESELDEFLEDLGDAEGSKIDRLGVIVNRGRHGRTDVLFRDVIKSDVMRFCGYQARIWESEPARDYETTPVSEWSELESDDFCEDLRVADGIILDKLAAVVSMGRLSGQTDEEFRGIVKEGRCGSLPR